MLNSKCLLCGDVIRGRIDKKFCSENCRAIHNYNQKLKTDETLISVTKTLKKNRSILRSLCREGETLVEKAVLDTLGYDFNHFSSIHITPDKKEIFYICFDWAFTPVWEGMIKKVRIFHYSPSMVFDDPWKFVRR